MKSCNRIAINIMFAVAFIFQGCTLHFKGKELEIDTKTKGAQIGNLIQTNHTFELAMIDIFKNAHPQTPRAP